MTPAAEEIWMQDVGIRRTCRSRAALPVAGRKLVQRRCLFWVPRESGGGVARSGHCNRCDMTDLSKLSWADQLEPHTLRTAPGPSTLQIIN